MKQYNRKIFGKSSRPRVSIFKSNKEIYAQIIDDTLNKTLVSSSSVSDKIILELKNKKKKKMELSYEVGKLLGIKAKKINIKKLVFDKKNYLYHGRIKFLIEGIRKSGIKL